MHATHTCTHPMSMRVCMLRLSNQQQQEEEEAREHQLLCSTCIKAHEKQHAKIKQFDFLFLALFICFFFCRHRYPLCPTPLRRDWITNVPTNMQAYSISHFTSCSSLSSVLLSSLFCFLYCLLLCDNRTTI